MKTFIALAGVVVGGVTITAATILTVWNFTAGLLMLAAAFTVLVFTAWLIRRHEDRDELAGLKAAHAEMHTAITACSNWVCEPANDLRERLKTVSLEWSQQKSRIEQLEADLRREREDRAAEQRRYATHMNACPVLDELMAEDHRKAQANR
jgi:hypothetical protein